MNILRAASAGRNVPLAGQLGQHLLVQRGQRSLFFFIIAVVVGAIGVFALSAMFGAAESVATVALGRSSPSIRHSVGGQMATLSSTCGVGRQLIENLTRQPESFHRTRRTHVEN